MSANSRDRRNIRPGIDENCSDLSTTCKRGPMESGHPIPLGLIHIRPGTHKHSNRFDVTFLRSIGDRRFRYKCRSN